MRFRIYIDLELVSGPERDEETMLDALCAAIGESNGAKPPVMITVGDEEFNPPESVYKIKMADDRP